LGIYSKATSPLSPETHVSVRNAEISLALRVRVAISRTLSGTSNCHKKYSYPIL
jgi:hypothetical protein